jgi:hypothetical protein
MISTRATAARLWTATALFLIAAAQSHIGHAQAPTQPFAPNASPPIMPQGPPQPAQQPPSTPGPQRGWFDIFGHWFDESVTSVNKGWDSMNQGLKSTWGAGAEGTKRATEAASGVAKDAADAVGRIGNSRLVTGQSVCAIAPNGAPDCRGAAESLCKSAGFASGSSVDYVTSEKCPTEAYVAGRRPAPGECRTEHTVTRALCQAN